MNLLHRLFGNDFRDENSNAKFELYNVLCKSIIEASWNCYLTVKDEIEIQDTDEAQTLRVSIYFEYLNFYMHLTNRLAHFKLNHIQHNSMQKYVGEFISEIAINTFFNTQPQQVKDSITSDFIYNLNISEMDYSSSKEIISSHHDFTGNSVFSKLGRKITEYVCDNMNPVIIALVITQAANEFSKMDLEATLNRISAIN